MKLLVTGHGRHGKDTMCEMLGMFGFSHKSSSMFACDVCVYPQWGKDYYADSVACYEDRHTGNNREIWYNLIRDYNTPEKSRLAKALLKEYDIYCGMRCKEELAACVELGLFDLKIWVDASERCPPESNSSMTITKDMCDIIVENNSTRYEFACKSISLGNLLSLTHHMDRQRKDI